MFCLRLREQGNLCEYGDHLDDEIKEQIFEKGASDDLRAKILNKPQMTLAETVEAGRSLETIGKHKNNSALGPAPVESGVEVNKIRSRTRLNRECYRCGKLGHFANDENCPAKDQKCKRCGMVGHFKNCCKTKKHKSTKGKRLRQVTGRHGSDSEDSDELEQLSDDSEEESVQYLFATEPGRKGTVACTVGSVRTNLVIDSGAGVNVIDRRTWEQLKKEKVRVKSQKPLVKKTLISYSGHPVEVAGMFSAEVATKRTSTVAKFYVAENGTCCLLGRKTSEALGILNINREACAPLTQGGRAAAIKLKCQLE
ncbi:uncharacterized protein LOC128093730 [Culex pipiens pallens]|uniref:uncharacterized protein LOC128093730 n=1 Tax=Culex pipiens pallens TaxID=42434 RepID=UPI0022AB1C9D|nr:uncharacterized protein LOC128093730 [Culex pipiens pallens]